jgi:2-polyprenyl-3-methyl-5-hydroxy-6-metoxy-1,4-benzoquinol methylase
LVFVNPQPTENALKILYSAKELLQQEGWTSYFEHSPKQIQQLWQERLSDLQRLENRANVRLLDIGSGYGDFLHYTKQLGWQVSGFDFSPSVAQVSREKYGILVATGDLFEVNYSDNSFDVITLWHVLEHTPDPLLVLKRSYDLLNRQGVLAIEVPNLNFILRRSYRYPFSVTLHLFHFSPTTLSALVQKAGFDILECKLGNTGFLYSKKTKIWAKQIIYTFSRAVERLLGMNICDSIRLYARKSISGERCWKAGE